MFAISGNGSAGAVQGRHAA